MSNGYIKKSKILSKMIGGQNMVGNIAIACYKIILSFFPLKKMGKD